MYLLWHAVAQLVEALRFKPGGQGFHWNSVIEFFFYSIDSAYDKNEYQEYYLGVKLVSALG
jgi:hypothetical protein